LRGAPPAVGEICEALLDQISQNTFPLILLLPAMISLRVIVEKMALVTV
jgi:hypothetical protein